jgi:hypothetical protein
MTIASIVCVNLISASTAIARTARRAMAIPRIAHVPAATIARNVASNHVRNDERDGEQRGAIDHSAAPPRRRTARGR